MPANAKSSYKNVLQYAPTLVGNRAILLQDTIVYLKSLKVDEV